MSALGLISSALGKGLEGYGKGYGKSIDYAIGKEAEEARLLREEHLASLQHGYRMEEAGEASRLAGGREESAAGRAAEQKDLELSGYVHKETGSPLTIGQMKKTPPDVLGSEYVYKDVFKAKAESTKKGELTKKDLTDIRQEAIKQYNKEKENMATDLPPREEYIRQYMEQVLGDGKKASVAAGPTIEGFQAFLQSAKRAPAEKPAQKKPGLVGSAMPQSEKPAPPTGMMAKVPAKKTAPASTTRFPEPAYQDKKPSQTMAEKNIESIKPIIDKMKKGYSEKDRRRVEGFLEGLRQKLAAGGKLSKTDKDILKTLDISPESLMVK